MLKNSIETDPGLIIILKKIMLLFLEIKGIHKTADSYLNKKVYL